MVYELPFTGDIKRLEEAERKLQLIEQTCLEYNVDMKPCENISKFLEKVDEFKETIGKPLQVEDIHDDLESTYAHIIG
jgi:hypothetical protein